MISRVMRSREQGIDAENAPQKRRVQFRANTFQRYNNLNYL
jgi:hypothetical protein